MSCSRKQCSASSGARTHDSQGPLSQGKHSTTEPLCTCTGWRKPNCGTPTLALFFNTLSVEFLKWNLPIDDMDPSILVNNKTFAEEGKQIVPDQTALLGAV